MGTEEDASGQQDEADDVLPPDVGPNDQRPTAGSPGRTQFYQRTPGWLFHLAVLLVMIFYLWQSSYPRLRIEARLIIVPAAAVLLLLWAARFVTYFTSDRSDGGARTATWTWGVVPVVVVVAVVVVHVFYGPQRIRFALSRDAFEEMVETCGQLRARAEADVAVTDEINETSGCRPGHIGRYGISRIEMVDDGVVFHHDGNYFFGAAGLAYLPAGADHARYWDDPDHRSGLRHLGGGWYSWSGSDWSDTDEVGDCLVSVDRLIRAATDGDIDALEAALGRGADPAPPATHTTPMACAIAAGRSDAVDVLLRAGAEPTRSDVDALIRGIYSGIGAPGIEPNEQDQADVLALLLDHRPDLDLDVDLLSAEVPLLLYTSFTGSEPAVEVLLDHGLDPDHGGELPTAFIDIVLGLELTEGDPHDRAIRDLVPEPSRDPVDNVPPLVVAIWQGHLDIAERLLEAGADPDLAADDAFTPLLAAALRNDPDAVELLLDHGADPNPQVRPDVPTPRQAAEALDHNEAAEHLSG